MNGLRRMWVGSALALALVAIASGTAHGDGLPVLGVDAGPHGVATVDGVHRYVTLPAPGGTVVAKIETEGGRVAASRPVPGNLTVPAVAYDGSADGISGDGSRLALIQPRQAFPRESTRFVVLAGTDLRTRSIVNLDGDFSFDAISPDGRVLYLIRYLSPTDPTDYEVRAYDVEARRLLPGPIVDPTEPDEEMGGTPITRAWSPDHRWAYTLYERPGKEAFIHALDTAGLTARCIDLAMLPFGEDLYQVQLSPGDDGSTLRVRRGTDAVAAVDTSTFAVTTGGQAPQPAITGNSDRGLTLVAGAPAVAALVLGFIVVVLRRRRAETRE